MIICFYMSRGLSFSVEIFYKERVSATAIIMLTLLHQIGCYPSDRVHPPFAFIRLQPFSRQATYFAMAIDMMLSFKQ